ncbi:MAG: hypothetical protein J2P57_14410 [Acidimicrobiaceae bacterium]|nr:hypothetical protein [Acidimicrobiaceae bacterium]
MVLRATRKAIVIAAIQPLVFGLVSGGLFYIAFTAHAVGAGITGIVTLVGVAALAVQVVNVAIVRLQLRDGILQIDNLLNHRSVHTSEITAAVPTRLSYRGRIRKYRSRTVFFDIHTARGSTGIWLNPSIYGSERVTEMLAALNLEPDTHVIEMAQ